LPLSGIESRYLGLRIRILITITIERPEQLWVYNTHLKIKRFIPSLGKIFISYQGRAQFAASANRLILYVFFWLIPRGLNFICRRFETVYLFHFYRQECKVFKVFTFLPIKMEQIKCSETSGYKIQTPGNYPEENIQHAEHGEGLYCPSR
jgi:hypothetical protein